MSSPRKSTTKAYHHFPKISLVLLQALKTPLLLYFAIIGNLMMVVGAYVFYFFEKAENPNVSHYGDALWWALCTISTVGYGDISPMTLGGRLVAAVLIVIGVTFFLSFMAVLVTVITAIETTPDSSQN